MNVERQKILLRRNVSHQRPPIIEMNCQVRPVVTLCILPTFPCPGKGFEGYQHELDVESIFRLPSEKSFILPAENCGMWGVDKRLAVSATSYPILKKRSGLNGAYGEGCWRQTLRR
jgi:hypothetical protein